MLANKCLSLAEDVSTEDYTLGQGDEDPQTDVVGSGVSSSGSSRSHSPSRRGKD